MRDRVFPDGTFDFKALISGEYFFVDKTQMIQDICRSVNMTYLFTRPRRFGKSINLSMLDYFFNIKYKDDPDIFAGLKIDSCPECKVHKNAYPVIKMNFADLRIGSRKRYYESLRSMVSEITKEFLYLIDDHSLSKEDKRFLSFGSESRLNEADTDRSIGRLCSILESVYGKKVIILVEEYDYCLQDGDVCPFIKYLSPFLEYTFKFNMSLRTGVVIGILPALKTDMLGLFKNLQVCTVLDPIGDEYFGFTEGEVKELLCEVGKPEKYPEIQKLYCGYQIGDAVIYNPYSIMMYLKNSCVPVGYWTRTGEISADLISNMSSETLSALKGLYENKGSALISPIYCDISPSEVVSPLVRPSVIYSYLVLTGYLKAVRTGKQENGVALYGVGMVNEEVAFDFEAFVKRAKAIEISGQRSSRADRPQKICRRPRRTECHPRGYCNPPEDR